VICNFFSSTQTVNDCEALKGFGPSSVTLMVIRLLEPSEPDGGIQCK